MLANLAHVGPFNVVPPISTVNRPGYMDPVSFVPGSQNVPGFSPSLYKKTRPDWAVGAVEVERQLELDGHFVGEPKYLHEEGFYFRVELESKALGPDMVGMAAGVVVVKPGGDTTIMRHYSPDHCFALMRHSGNPRVRAYHMTNGRFIQNKTEPMPNPDVLLVLDSIYGFGFSIKNASNEDLVVSFRFVARTDQVYHAWRLLAALAETRILRRVA